MSKINPNYKHQLSNQLQEEWKTLKVGGWRPTIAYPLFVGFGLKKAQCDCGRVFKTQEDFEAHYLYRAVWKLESNVLPSEWKDTGAA